MIPLISFEVVEWYRPDRVMRQFGLHQTTLMPCDTNVALHSLDRRGRPTSTEWSARHAGSIILWEERWQHVIEREPSSRVMRVDDPYMIWYMGITRRFITDPMSGDPSRFTPSSPIVHDLVCPFVVCNVYGMC